MFKNLEETSRYLIILSTAISFIFLVIGFLLLNDHAAYAQGHDFKTLVGGRYPYVLGIFVGTVFTIIKILSIDHSCKKALDMDVNASKLYGTGQYFFRFILSAAVLVGAILLPQISFAGTVLATLSLQFAGYLLPLWQKRSPAGSSSGVSK